MSSKGFTSSLPFKLVIALALGTAAGLIISATEGNMLSTALMHIVVTIRHISSQFVNFCVPIIILGFVAPSITRLGQNASRMLILALILAYSSSIGAALAATAAGYSILPFMNIVSEVEGLKALPKVLFALSIPQIMPVMSALLFAIMVGLAAAWNRSRQVINLLEEFHQIVLSLVTRFMIPVLPWLIGTTFCTLAYEGSITKQFPVFVMVIIMVMIGHYIWLALLYFIGGVYSGKNPFNIIRNYGPAYMTAVGTMSSAATLSVALECARKSEPTLRDDLVNFGIPLFANIHLCGSVMTETFFVMAVSKILYGFYPSVSNMILFSVLLGLFAIAAPGVPGGTVMASLGLITGLLGFDDTGTALMLTIFALQDSFGTACNVTGDGALTLILTGYAEKHGIGEEKLGDILS